MINDEDSDIVVLKRDLLGELSRSTITSADLKEIKRNLKEKFVIKKIFETEHIALHWAIKKKIVTEHDLENLDYFSDEGHMKDLIASSGLAITGSVASLIAYPTTIAHTVASTSTAWGIFGTVGIHSTVGSSLTIAATHTLLATAAPIAVAGASIYGAIKYLEHKENGRFITHFNTEKTNIINFYLDQINRRSLLDKKEEQEQENSKKDAEEELQGPLNGDVRLFNRH
jgi:hypothetical protein